MTIESLSNAVGDAYPDALYAREEVLVEARRAKAGIPASGDTIGVACSGGGIRSATTCLGFFQALAEHTQFRRIDFLSSVSGGGYFGTFLGALYHRWNPGDKSATQVEAVTGALCNFNSAPIRWLRENGRYIAPKGTSDFANIVGIYVRNWIGLHFVIGTMLLTISMALLLLASILNWITADYFGPSSYYCFTDTVCLLLSPFLWLIAFVAVLGLLPLFWAFWLTQHNSVKRPFPGVLIGNGSLYITLVVVAALLFAIFGGLSGASTLLCEVAAAVGILALIYWISYEFKERNAVGHQASAGATVSLVRNDLSSLLTIAVTSFTVATAIALIDIVARNLFASSGTLKVPSTIYLALGGVASALYKLAPLLTKGRAVRTVISESTIASIAGFVLLFFVAVGWYYVALWITDYATTSSNLLSLDPGIDFSLWSTFLFLAVLLMVTYVIGVTIGFINLSSLQQFYSARLRRAYLGASNTNRINKLTGEISDDVSINREIAGDDIPWARYKPHENGGPLHLIAMTVNSTTHGASQLEMQDRKGVLMAVGPAGISVGTKGHAIWEEVGDETRLTPLQRAEETAFKLVDAQASSEPFTLSRLMAVSGAAFSTGLGARTRSGLSVLLGSANIRLGYWWYSASKDWDAGRTKLLKLLFRTQCYLYQEFLGRFPGYRQRHWYLSDGGHAENTGAYELIRRRVSRIIVLDNGADPGYQFEDFANLVRRVRIDFGVQVDAVDLEEAEGQGLLTPGTAHAARPFVGALNQVARGPAPNDKVALSKACLSLFRISYPGSTTTSLLILAKPTLLGDEPADVMEYAASHPAFPQEPTSDQFFDEAQWESYRRMGYEIGSRFTKSMKF